MSDLPNSRRVSYKATYVQTKFPGQSNNSSGGPRSPGRRDRDLRTRALDKTAFVQGLRITRSELATLRKQVSRRSHSNRKAELAAINAIENLVTDRSLTASVRNARHFAEVSTKALISTAGNLADDRAQTFKRATEIVSSITKQYLASTQPTPVSLAPPPTTRVATTTLNTATASTTVRAATVSGIPLKVVTKVYAEVKSTPAAGATARATHRTRSSIEPVGSTIGSLPLASIRSLDSSAPKMALPGLLTWAGQKCPDLLKSLHGIVLPYSQFASAPVITTPTVPAIVDGMALLQVSASTVDESIKAFKDRLNIEPIGRLHLERLETYPAGIEKGELVHSIPLSPKETVNISHKEWAVRQEEFEDIVQDIFESYSEQGVSEKNELAQATDSESKHTSALNVGASLSASYSSVTLSSSFGYNTSSDDQESKKDSRNHSMQLTKKAAARTKKDHKFSFKVSSIAGSSDEAVRTITNPTDSVMRVDYFQLVRKWKVDLLRYGVRMTYDIVIPNPGSALITRIQRLSELDKLINLPFIFDLPLAAITYSSYATDPSLVSNYDSLAAQYEASVTAPPEAIRWLPVHKETDQNVKNYDDVHYDSVEFEVDENYYIEQMDYDLNFENKAGDTKSVFSFLNDGPQSMVAKSGKLALDFAFQYVWIYAFNIILRLRPKAETLIAWRIKVWNELRQAAEEQYIKSRQAFKDERAQLEEEIKGYDALTLRRMEQEEIMKGVLRWLFGPSFHLVPANIASLYMLTDSNDPEVREVLDPNQLSAREWLHVMEHGEFIKYVQNAIEWENVLHFTYPYFWDTTSNWDLKKFLYHPDPRHRVFLRAGAARVVLTIRPGFEDSFTQLVESGAFAGLPGPHPYVAIAQEIQNFARTNYPGFPPANPEQTPRPLLYPKQRQAWTYMQELAARLEDFKAASSNGLYPTTAQGLAALPGAAIQKDPWGNDYVYKRPGVTNEYDLLCLGADGKEGGTEEDADISVNAEASLISTWFEYTPTSALDISITTKLPEIA